MSNSASHSGRQGPAPDPMPRGGGKARRRFSVDWGGLTHRGFARVTNEDCFFVGRFDRMLQPILTNLLETAAPHWHYDSGYAAVVADGMGGKVAGEVASHTAVATLIDLAVDTPDWIMRYDDPSLVAQVSARIQERIKQVDELLQAIGRSQPKLAGMGTTVTVLAVLPPHALVAHVGHSRAYLMRGGELRQVTRDHTVAQKLVDAGLIDTEDVSRHPTSSVLTRAAGRSRGRLPVDVHRLSLVAGDQILLCTNGLTDMVADDDISRVLAGTESSALACKTLVDRALDRGGDDNVTVVVGRLREDRPRTMAKG
jgi:PPM family protein phosphatase